MGVFDSTFLACPSCAVEREFQSKAGECFLHTYPADNVPLAIAGDLVGEVYTCKCGTTSVVAKEEVLTAKLKLVLQHDKTSITDTEWAEVLERRAKKSLP